MKSSHYPQASVATDGGAAGEGTVRGDWVVGLLEQMRISEPIRYGLGPSKSGRGWDVESWLGR